MENDEAVPNLHCYHLSGRHKVDSNEIRDIKGLKNFQFGSHLSRVIFKDFQIGSIISGYNNCFQAMLRRAADAQERKTFVSSGCNHLWLEKLYGIPRVAVYGVDSMCVVTWNKDLVPLEKDLARLKDSGEVLDETLRYALISEVEELAWPPNESRLIKSQRSQKPFGVVSVIAGTKKFQKVNHDEASVDKFDELEAIKFLREKLNNTSHFTFHKTVKTAVRAFHLLVNKKKFKLNKIRVFVWKSEWEEEDSDCDYEDAVQELKGKDLFSCFL